MRVQIAPAALEDLRNGANFYAQRAGADLALAFISEFERAIKIIENNPTVGAVFRGLGRRYLLRRFPYSVIYQCKPEDVEECINVLAVAHHRQRPGYWEKR